MVRVFCKYVSRYSLLVRGETVLRDTKKSVSFHRRRSTVSPFKGPAAGPGGGKYDADILKTGGKLAKLLLVAS